MIALRCLHVHNSSLNFKLGNFDTLSDNKKLVARLWQKMNASQQATYPDANQLNRAVSDLSQLLPITFHGKWINCGV